MPHELLHFPDEILEEIMKNLMPSLSAGRPSIIILEHESMRKIPVPKDLCRLMTVCRIFYRLALPHVWSRVSISLEEEWATEYYRSSHIPGQWQYLIDHPELAVYIRLLKLEIHEWDSPTFALSLGALRLIVSFMENIRILRIGNASKCETVDHIYKQLLSKPYLQTIILAECKSRTLPLFPNSYITHLNIHGWEDTYANLLRATPFLKSLVITQPEEYYYKDDIFPLETLSPPWATLRRIALRHFHDWYLVLKNLSSWKQSNPTRTPPLCEIYIGSPQAWIAPSEINLLTSIGLDLRALSLYGPSSINNTFLVQITEAFPRLQDLSLFAEERWNLNLSTISHFLEKLPMLKRFSSDYACGDMKGEENIGFPQMVEMIASRCAALEYLGFKFFIDEWISYTIMRDGMGRYEGCCEEDICPPEFFYPSSWNFGNSDKV